MQKVAGERYVYKFVCDPEALFTMAFPENIRPLLKAEVKNPPPLPPPPPMLPPPFCQLPTSQSGTAGAYYQSKGFYPHHSPAGYVLTSTPQAHMFAPRSTATSHLDFYDPFVHYPSSHVLHSRNQAAAAAFFHSPPNAPSGGAPGSETKDSASNFFC